MCAIEPLSWAPAPYFDDPSTDPPSGRDPGFYQKPNRERGGGHAHHRPPAYPPG
ncbi:hypothetical protein [Candidatus Competibacter phosphatis]|uniref:hypothetical protein n=1 Tax=Candidatus Competibacter phosphatis TaxID=221280 RepID=UPI00145D0995|nr:hypothetical protein [Candidatus Competibacter phosphatis]